MDRFFDDNDNDNNPEQFNFSDDYFDEEMMDDGAVAFIDKDDLINVMHMDIAKTELDLEILSKAIKIAENSLFWRFRSSSYKMKEIENIYERLIRLTDGDPEKGIENGII